jgi:hypothetical protein
MPTEGIEKKRLNFIDRRVLTQTAFWPEYVEKWDSEANGKKFKSEVLSLTELWNLYLGYVRETDAEETSLGRVKAKSEAVKKPKKGYVVCPIKAFELPGRFNERSEHHEGPNGYLHFDQWLLARDQARKELFWLGKEVFDMDFYAHVHQVTCDQFVQKDFDGVFKDGFGRNNLKAAFARQNRCPRIWVETKKYPTRQSEVSGLDDYGYYMRDPARENTVNDARTMILLDPRGFFKTFTNILDTVQWIINCPDVRILIMSGTYKLTLQFLSLAKGKFHLPPGMKPGKFHLLFPEYVNREADGDSKEPLVLPNRSFDSPDPTLGIMSIGSSLSGFHCDILKFDDIVTDENCNTDETRQSLLDKADGAVNLLMPWGWHDIIGTRYFPDDYYGQTLRSFKENPEDFNLKFFTRAAWVVKPEFKHIEENSIFQLTEEMVILTFPEHKPFKALRKDLIKNERSFRCQQLNQPVWGDEKTISFDRVMLEGQASKTLSEVLATPGTVYGAIDLARENKQFSDFTALAVGKVYQEGFIPGLMMSPEQGVFQPNEEGKYVMVILDVQFGKWSQHEIATRVASMHDKWRPKQWYGEDTGGLILLKEKIVDTSKTTYGHWPYIRWEEPENSEGAKRNRIKGFESLLRSKRCFFLLSPAVSWSEVFEQLEKYKGQKSTRYFKDDVPDVLAQLSRFVPSMIQASKKELEEQARQKEEEYKEYLRREMKRQIFGDDMGGFGSRLYTPYDTLPEEPQRGPMGGIGGKFFGGNGMRA